MPPVDVQGTTPRPWRVQGSRQSAAACRIVSAADGEALNRTVAFDVVRPDAELIVSAVNGLVTGDASDGAAVKEGAWYWIRVQRSSGERWEVAQAGLSDTFLVCGEQQPYFLGHGLLEIGPRIHPPSV
jgi:hypothetical protein